MQIVSNFSGLTNANRLMSTQFNLSGKLIDDIAVCQYICHVIFRIDWIREIIKQPNLIIHSFTK